jgi:hypothetical protein
MPNKFEFRKLNSLLMSEVNTCKRLDRFYGRPGERIAGADEQSFTPSGSSLGANVLAQCFDFGIIAYGLYQRPKRAWMEDFRAQEGRYPNSKKGTPTHSAIGVTQ